MKSKIIVCMLFVVGGLTGNCFGRAKTNDPAMTLEQIKARVADTHAKDKRLIVRLKTGGTISGTVLPTTVTNFMLLHGEGLPSCSTGN